MYLDYLRFGLGKLKPTDEHEFEFDLAALMISEMQIHICVHDESRGIPYSRLITALLIRGGVPYEKHELLKLDIKDERVCINDKQLKQLGMKKLGESYMPKPMTAKSR